MEENLFKSDPWIRNFKVETLKFKVLTSLRTSSKSLEQFDFGSQKPNAAIIRTARYPDQKIKIDKHCLEAFDFGRPNHD